MDQKPSGKQYRVLAIAWTLAAAAMALAVVRHLPQIRPALLLLLALSLIVSAVSWRAWKTYQNNDQTSQINQDSEEKEND